MLKANNKDSRATSLTLFWRPYCSPRAQPTPRTSAFTTKFEQPVAVYGENPKKGKKNVAKVVILDSCKKR